MNEENPNMGNEALIQGFKDVLHTLLKDTISKAPEGSPERAEGDAHRKVLQEFLAPFIVTWNDSKPPDNIWELLQPHLLENLSNQSGIQDQLKATYSAPLKGDPVTIVQTMGLLNIKKPSFLSRLGDKARQNLNPQQNIYVIKTLGRL